MVGLLRCLGMDEASNLVKISVHVQFAKMPTCFVMLSCWRGFVPKPKDLGPLSKTELICACEGLSLKNQQKFCIAFEVLRSSEVFGFPPRWRF